MPDFEIMPVPIMSVDAVHLLSWQKYLWETFGGHLPSGQCRMPCERRIWWLYAPPDSGKSYFTAFLKASYRWGVFSRACILG